MTDLDQIALDTVEAIANIDPDKLKGGRVQALAQVQCLVRDALQELEDVGAENYTLTQEVDAALDQVIYWRERAVDAEAERDALAAHVSALVEWADSYVGTAGLYEAVESARKADTTSLARLKAKWQAEALERCAEGVAACKPGATPRGISIAIKMEAEELRRQAEEEG